MQIREYARPYRSSSAPAPKRVRLRHFTHLCAQAAQQRRVAEELARPHPHNCASEKTITKSKAMACHRPAVVFGASYRGDQDSDTLPPTTTSNTTTANAKRRGSSYSATTRGSGINDGGGEGAGGERSGGQGREGAGLRERMTRGRLVAGRGAVDNVNEEKRFTRGACLTPVDAAAADTFTSDTVYDNDNDNGMEYDSFEHLPLPPPSVANASSSRAQQRHPPLRNQASATLSSRRGSRRSTVVHTGDGGDAAGSRQETGARGGVAGGGTNGELSPARTGVNRRGRGEESESGAVDLVPPAQKELLEGWLSDVRHETDTAATALQVNGDLCFYSRRDSVYGMVEGSTTVQA